LLAAKEMARQLIERLPDMAKFDDILVVKSYVTKPIYRGIQPLANR